MDERGGGATGEPGGFGRGIRGFKVFVVVGDSKSHVGLGIKCSKEVATAIRGAIIVAKLWVIPVRRGYKIGKPHTMHCKVTGKCGSVIVGMVLAPRGSGIMVARVPKKVFQFAGIDDVFTSSKGSTKTLETLSRKSRGSLLKMPMESHRLRSKVLENYKVLV
ncbi:small ribosomal subunit protein uS5w-like isoform X2 [Rosa rugosa]|uniref:small ribosomal subunit protein uS5w-like isoform X2 n=1 Tax=Rosa rugosa TaxID=74645 RepID=UPI002B40630F|nr:small ribosomal subunit protein uS5w-like isoform X2 [Rosa rugosa]